MAPKVTGIDIVSMEAKRFSEKGRAPKNVKVDNNSSIITIQPAGEKNASIKFRYTLNYQGMGFITFEGTLYLECNVKEDLGDWTKSGNLPPDTASIVHNAILRKCLTTSLLLSREVELPPPIPLPTINFKKKNGKEAPGSTGTFEMYQ